MAVQSNDNLNINAPKGIDQRTGKFVSGVWQPFDSIADANTRVNAFYRHKGLTVNINVDGEIKEYWYKNGITDNDLVPKSPKAYSSFASLAAATDRYESGTILTTKGFYQDGDGGGASYIVSTSPLSGLASGSPAQVGLPGGKYAILNHHDSVNLEQFGAKGDGITNDYMALFYTNNFKQIKPNLHTIYGTPNKSYLLRKQTRAIPNISQFNFDTDCLLRVNYAGCTWDGRGSKLLWDANFNQSRVYLVKGGMTHVYRAKVSNINQYPQANVMSDNSWYDYYWQMMEYNVTPNGSYPYWDNSTQYYGSENFCHIGYGHAAQTGPTCENITFRNWDISGMETNAVALDSGMWNIFAKGFNIQFYYDNILYENIKLHHICSEMFYGGAEIESGRQTIKGCEIYMGHNGISGGGFPFYIQDNIFYDLSANAVENFPFDGKLVITGNDIKRCGNGLTIGGPGNDIQIQGDVTVQDNRIEDCQVYGVYFSGRARGVNISNNIFYDTGMAFYMLSNLGFPMVASEYMISNNQIYAHKKGVNFGLILNSASFDNGNTTTNIFIKDNVFGTTSLKDIQGFPQQMGTAISFYGDLYKDIVIDGNTFVGRITKYYEYVVKNQNFSPIFGRNFYRTSYSDHNIAGGVSGGTYNAPTTIDSRYIFGDNMTYQIGTAPPSDGWGTSFFTAPPLRDLYYRTDCESIYVNSFFQNRVVIVPSGNDNLKRAYIIWANLANSKRGVRMNLIQANNSLERINEVGQRTWEYVGMNDSVQMPLINSFIASEFVFGNLAPGAEDVYGFYSNIFFNNNFDQYFPDRDYENNLLLVPGITVLGYEINYSGSFNLTVRYRNDSGGIINRDGKVIAFKAYPISKPAILPTNIAPLREEGLTNMIPLGDDIPNKFLFRDVEANQYLEYQKKTRTWVVV